MSLLHTQVQIHWIWAATHYQTMLVANCFHWRSLTHESVAFRLPIRESTLSFATELQSSVKRTPYTCETNMPHSRSLFVTRTATNALPMKLPLVRVHSESLHRQSLILPHSVVDVLVGIRCGCKGLTLKRPKTTLLLSYWNHQKRWNWFVNCSCTMCFSVSWPQRTFAP